MDNSVQNEELEIPKTNWKQGYILASVVFAIWILSAIAVYFVSSKWEVRGQFGDMFGAINALFSGLAFAGLIYTIILQREELALQRKELVLTRDELKRSAEAQEEASKALNAQLNSMTITAKINALSTLIDYYKHAASKDSIYNNYPDRMNAESKARELTRQIEKYMAEIK